MGPKTLSWLIMWSSLALEVAMVHCEVYDTVQLVSLEVSQNNNSVLLRTHKISIAFSY